MRHNLQISMCFNFYKAMAGLARDEFEVLFDQDV